MASKFIGGAQEQWNGIMVFLGAIRKQVSHTNIVQLIDLISTETCAYLVMARVMSGHLQARLSPHLPTPRHPSPHLAPPRLSSRLL